MEPVISNAVVLRMTYRQRILSDLPNMVDPVRERNISHSLNEALKNS